MKTLQASGLALLLFLFIAALPAAGRAAEIRLSVAASMSDAIRTLVAAYTKEHPTVTILPNLGSSGSLAKQIAQGAPADLFISANRKWVDYLVKAGRVDRSTVHAFAANSLVVVGAPLPGVTSLATITALPRIAIGSPQSVPAGQYAAQAMRGAGIYDELLSAHKLVMAKDVRQALLYADRGEVAAAFVYRTDALLARQAVILFTVPANLHDPIVYPMGLTKAGSSNDEAKAFYAFLTSPRALTVLERFGFSAPPAASR